MSTATAPSTTKARRHRDKMRAVAAECDHIRGPGENPDVVARRLGYANVGTLINALEHSGYQQLANRLAADRDAFKARYTMREPVRAR